jgi:hypothetical protein
MAYLTLMTGWPPDRALVSEMLRQRLDGEDPVQPREAPGVSRPRVTAR